ncbi:hypothetical protein SESBI_41639 [Sesbania bispinosa]|nr:hypothetical protein SESBI_41639 [Sesbania bispinosa]
MHIDYLRCRKEKEEIYRSIGFIKNAGDKHVLELEIERMRGTLRIMRHMGDAGDGEILEKMDMVQEQLKEKEKVYRRI